MKRTNNRVNFESLTYEQFLAMKDSTKTEQPESLLNDEEALIKIANEIPSDDIMENEIKYSAEAANELLENEEPQVATDEEVSIALKKAQRQNQRESFVLNMLAAQCDAYYNKHKFYPSGKERRAIKREIERNYDKGRYKSILESNLN